MRLLIKVVIMFALLNSFSPSVWTRYGVVQDGGAETAGEPSVIYEGDAQILTGSVFKMWWTSVWGSPQLNYSESLDGITWTNYDSNPVIASAQRGHVMKDGTTYYCYLVNGTQYDLHTSSDGISWSLDTSAVLSVGAGGQWDDYGLGNIFVWKEGTDDWRLIYEARDGAGEAWCLGYATASAPGGAWTKYGSNPVISEAVSNGGPEIYKASNGVFWMYYHKSGSVTTPTDIYRSSSSDLITWTTTPNRPVFSRMTVDEGHGSAVGQIADPSFVELNGKTYMWYAAFTDGTQESGNSGIKLAISRLPLDMLVLHNE